MSTTRTLFLPSPSPEDLALWETETRQRVEDGKPPIPPGDTEHGGLNLPGWSIQDFRRWRDQVTVEARAGAHSLTTPQDFAREHGIHPPVLELSEAESMLLELAEYRRQNQTESDISQEAKPDGNPQKNAK